MAAWKQAVWFGYEVYAIPDPPVGQVILRGPAGRGEEEVILYLTAEQVKGLYGILHQHHDKLI